MLDQLLSRTPRRGFLGRIAATAAGVAGVGVLGFVDRASAAVTGRSDSSNSKDPELEAWFAKLGRGKHRVLFDAPAANEGMPAVWPRIYLNTTEATYPGEGAVAMVILRHHGIALALQDSIWAKYHVGTMVGDSDAALTSNPYATITTLPLPGLGIRELLKSGVLIGVCDVALTVSSAGAAAKMGTDAAAVKKEWVAGLFPGIQVVPSGVMAVGRGQEFNAGYIFAG